MYAGLMYNVVVQEAAVGGGINPPDPGQPPSI